MIDQGVADTLATRDANTSTNGEDSHNSGTCIRRTENVARECTYQDFIKCQPLFFKGTKGVVKLTQWFEQMETMTVGHDVAMTWTNLKKKMTDKYYSRSEIKKLKVELWNFEVKKVVYEESSIRLRNMFGGLDDMIQTEVLWHSRPRKKIMKIAIEMATELMDKMIHALLVERGDNKPPMLEKHLYDSWKSRMELYMLNRPHGRMILASVEKGPLVWPSITEDGVTRLKEYVELTPAEAIQADCDIKAINIILQGLPTEIYALVSQHRVAKDLWEKIKLLMQGTSLTKQERECKLYDEFDKFTYKKGESLHEYYLRFTLLLNDMNIYKMPLEQFQVNTKFLNTLPDEWSKFVTDVKLVKDLHTTNVDQLHAYLQQHERHANEVRLMHERNSDPLALVASHQLPPSTYQSHLHTLPNSQLQHHVSPYPSSQFVTPYQTQQFTTSQSTPLSITYPSNEYQSSVHHNVYSPQSSIPQLEYAPTTYQHQQSEFSQPDSGLIVPVFQKGDDPIDAINHMMSFLTAVVTSRYPTTNNQLRTSIKPSSTSYTICDGKIALDGESFQECSRCTHLELKELKAPSAGFDQVCQRKRPLPTTINEHVGFKHTKACFRDEIIPFIKELKDIFNNFNQYLVDELADVQNVFYQMEQAVEQHRLESRTFEVKMNQVLSENERLLA
ncbi:hypothetical protein Tco_0907197 [Tanacetum coccineum]|uniref:Uncharacterized protein n=1 Tax=Tanacetum coccineum TaxID=301880 RepID=A0ABQ5CKK4_9ASTR